MRRSASLAFAILSSFATAAQSQQPDAAKKAEQAACTPCHSLRLVESQRLSAAAWAKEVDKMIGWGAVVPDRQLLIDYLAREYSDAKPVPKPDSSRDSAPAKSNVTPSSATR